MIPAFDDILQSRDKNDLEAYARLQGVELDKRRSFENMLADFRAATETPEPAPEPAPAPVAPGPRLIEVVTLRKYVPHGFVGEDGAWRRQAAEIKESVPPGTVLALPAEEAERALKAGIAQITANSFR